MSTFVCPHCGGLNKVISQKHPADVGVKTVESVAPSIPPQGKLRSLLWFLWGNKPGPPLRPTDITVRIEEFDYPKHQVKLNDFDSRVTYKICIEIALMIKNGHDWTRANLVEHTSCSENKTRIVVREFKKLGYLRISPNNRSEVTTSGRRFLRGVLATDCAQKL